MEVRKLKDLTPYDKNPRKNKAAVDRVLESLNRHGQVKPIVISAKGKPFEQEVICAGHTTLEALKRFGAKEAKVVTKAFADEAQFVDYNIRDNKTGEFAEWDEAMLADLNAEFDLDVSEMGFDFEEPEENEGLTDEDEVPEVPEEPTAQKGQIWKLGEHRLMCGNSTSKEDVELLMSGAIIEMVFTDIPYNISQSSNGLRNLDYGEWDKNVHDIGEKVFSFGYGESFYYFCGDEQLSGILSKMKQEGCSTRNFVWKKTNPTVMNGQNIWLPSQELCAYGKRKGAKFNLNCEHSFHEGAPNGNRVHPNQKPIDLVERCIIASSDKKDNVLDFFGGSGSTLIACEKTNRKCYMMELSPAYCDVIIKRWEEYTGKKAELTNDAI